jgi:membrane fusion protein, heavy metal efflux system
MIALPRSSTAARAALSLLLLSGASAGCRRAVAPSSGAAAPRLEADHIEFAADSPQLKEFKVEATSSGSAASLSFTGRLAWNEDATSRIVPPVAGRITRLVAPLGARVRRGSVLAELSSPDFGQAQADASRAAADLAAAERSRERFARLFERGAAPRKDLDAAEADLARSRAEAGRTRERLLRWGGDPASAPDQIYRVRSPLDGVVVERNANLGQEVRPDAAAPLFVVTDPSRLWVLLDVTERDLPATAKGDRLLVRSGAYPDRTFSGRLEWVGDSLDPASRTVRVRGTVPDPARMLKAEMYVTVEDAGERPRPAVFLPVAAVLTDGSRPFCFVQEAPNRFRRVAIGVGPERDGRVPVLSGLPPGARVVTEGSLLLSTFFAPEPGG